MSRTPSHAGRPVEYTDNEWRRRLNPEQYAICRCAATEPAFTGKYWDHHATGTYACVACGADLFHSDSKFDSGSGWPSYSQPVHPGAVVEQDEAGEGKRRVEVRCAQCHSHLGHVFPDGPLPAGRRYCVNSAALEFRPGK